MSSISSKLDDLRITQPLVTLVAEGVARRAIDAGCKEAVIDSAARVIQTAWRDRWKCSICLDDAWTQSDSLSKTKAIGKAICGHSFHLDCAAGWGRGNPCPLCKTEHVFKEMLPDPKPLFDAVKAQDSKQLVDLLDSGVNPNVIGEEGRTPLHLAAGLESEGCIRALIKSGAQVNLPDNRGLRPLHYAATFSNASSTRALLIARADPNALSDSETTPLHIAVEGGALDYIKLLVEARADPFKGKKGETPLDLAMLSRSTAIFKYLLHADEIPAVDSREFQAMQDTLTPWMLTNSRPTSPNAGYRTRSVSPEGEYRISPANSQRFQAIQHTDAPSPTLTISRPVTPEVESPTTFGDLQQRESREFHLGPFAIAALSVASFYAYSWWQAQE